MKTVCKKLLCLMLVAMMLVSAVPFAFAAGTCQECDWVVKSETAATCSANKKIVYECDDCHSTKEEEVANTKLAHDYEEVITPPTCTVDGSKKNVCQVCGDTQTIEVYEAQGHNFIGKNDCNICYAENPDKTTGSGNQGSGNTNTNYGTLTVHVMAYNADEEARDVGTVPFQGQPSYTINRALAEECFEEVGIVNYEEYQWQGASGTLDMTNGKNYEVTLVADPIRTPGNRKIVTLKIVDNDGTSHYQTVETLAGTKILDVLSYAEEHDYFDKPTRKGYRLAGYSFDMNCSNDVNRDDVINADMTIYCEWEKTYVANKYDVTLRVYTNGDTQYVDKVFDMEDYAGDGKITRTEVENLLDKKYSAKKGYSLAYYGLFTAETWDDGDYDTDDAVSSIKVNDNSKTVIYVMVKNVKKAVADSSNPKTGDNIMIAATTLALSAAALVSMVELKKRKMI